MANIVDDFATGSGGSADDWTFEDNCADVLTAPACDTAPFPEPDGTISGRRGQGDYELGVSDLSDQSFTQTAATVYERQVSRLRDIPLIASTITSTFTKRRSATADDTTYTAEFFLIPISPTGPEVVLNTQTIDVGTDANLTVSVSAAPYRGMTVRYGWRLIRTSLPGGTPVISDMFIEEFDDGSWSTADDSYSDPPNWVLAGNSYWQAVPHGVEKPGRLDGYPFEYIDATNPLTGHGTNYLGIGGSNGGAAFVAYVDESLQSGVFRTLVNTRSVEISAFMRVWPTDLVTLKLSLYLMARQTASAFTGYGVTIGNVDAVAGGEVISTFGLRLKTLDLNDVFITALDSTQWHHPRLTVIPNGSISDRLIVELETSLGSGVWTTVHDETILAANPRYVPITPDSRISFGRGMDGGWWSNPGGFDGLKVIVSDI